MKTDQTTPSVSYSFIMRLSYPNRIGMFARIVSTIGKHGGDLGAVDIVTPDAKLITRDITVRAVDDAHQEKIVSAVRRITGVKVANVSDRVFLLHLGGKIAIQNKVPVTTRDTLSMAYTPGVARVCEAIAADPRKAWQLTIKGNSVAVVSDGTAVLGLGDIGPEAAMPVMEGKAMLFKEFAGIDAYPICLRTKDPDEIVAAVKHLSVGFGGINLEDISAPRCFEIERKLQEQLDIPVFHDDQHGTAVVVLAALLNALRLTGQKMERLKIVIVGAGAAGMAITRILLRGGARDIVVCDREGILHQGLSDLNESKAWIAQHTNPRNLRGRLQEGCQSHKGFITAAMFADAVPGAGSKLCSIADSAANKCAGGKSSYQLADEIEADAKAALALADKISTTRNTELGVTLNSIKSMSYLSIYYAYKIRGATFLKGNDKEKARDALGQAYCWWMKYSNLMGSMFKGMKMQRGSDMPDWRIHDQSVLKEYTDLGGKGIPSCEGLIQNKN